jgi:hypothetical protein
MALSDCNPNTAIGGGPENTNYLVTNFFTFTIEKIPDFRYYVQSVNLPMLTSRSINQPAVFGTYPKIPATNFTFDDLQVTFLLDAEMKSWKSLYDWIKTLGNLKNYNDAVDHQDKFSMGTLLITNSAYKPVMKANFHHIFPVNLGSVNFSVTATTTTPVSISANFAYSYYEIVDL